MPGKAAKVVVSEKQFALLTELSKSRSVPQFASLRATIVLRAFQKQKNEVIAAEVGLNPQQVGTWRRRWRDSWEKLCEWECREPGRLREAVLEVLSDIPRSGRKPTLTPAEVAHIIALACEPPEQSGRPITHWTHRELHDEILKREITATISLSHVGNLLRRAATQPHRRKMWVNTREKDPVKFEREVRQVCQTYREAPQAAEEGRHTVCIDEATSLQAVERKAPDKPTQRGSVAKHEGEYARHGTTTLTAGLDVVTGRIVSPTLEATRTEPEFAAHIERTVAADPDGEWVFVVDNLNTHCSETLVRWVAERCAPELALGKKVPTAC